MIHPAAQFYGVIMKQFFLQPNSGETDSDNKVIYAQLADNDEWSHLHTMTAVLVMLL